ncbi:MerR family transcriptional regulator [Cryptosporangium aurantiacum]|uniref:DNA-binding transcriptional regulator, MerR family n=1 Tax=Cryptosporangium aurantiacum TaxID=134849 RepID=A0A1M7RDU9_9ACTN|nr:MerR family transcriptional regulator [Cryptosporangium aurantiacum]SHN44380.1 DNA-binding transcriptional regulator, MerR family [Cryptosporangium aurantiacum]
MTRYSIGDLARRTGLTVKAIRFYADRGIVPPSGRNAAGHRVYDEDAAARLRLVRSLRDLGVDLATIRRILERDVTLADVASRHADALDVQIRALRFRRAVLTAIAAHGPDIEEISMVQRLATLSEDERRRLVDEFLTATFDGLERTDPAFVGIRRSLTPTLPDDADPAVVDAWIELVELAQDPEFRASMRRLAEQHAADREPGTVPRPEAVAVVRAHLPAGTTATPPSSPAAARVVTTVAGAYARVTGEPDTPALRKRLRARLELANDPRRERYESLLATVNGWPPNDPVEPTLTWCIQALRAHPGTMTG